MKKNKKTEEAMYQSRIAIVKKLSEIKNEDNEAYFSIEWLQKNILCISPKYEKRIKVVKKLLNNNE